MPNAYVELDCVGPSSFIARGRSVLDRRLQPMLLSRFISKLQTRTKLSNNDVAALGSLPGILRSYAAKKLVQSEEAPTRRVGFLLSGFVSSFKIVQGDKTQITGFHLPGDAIDIASVLTKQPNAHAVAHARSEVLWVASRDIVDICFSRPNVVTALWLDTLIDAGISREWIANIGQRRATQRIGHLLLELATRYEILDGPRASFSLPVSQSYLASALGLSLVHLNKSLGALEKAGLISRTANEIIFRDRVSLREQVGFDAKYLWPTTIETDLEPARVTEILQLV